MVGGSSGRNTGRLTRDNMGIVGYIGGSRSCDEPRGLCTADKEGYGYVASRVQDAKDTRRGGERTHVVVCFVDDAILLEVQWREVGVRFKSLTASLVGAHFQATEERG